MVNLLTNNFILTFSKAVIEVSKKYENGEISIDVEKKKIDEDRVEEHITMEVIVEIAQYRSFVLHSKIVLKELMIQ
mgnify:CR=1 FL=1